MHRASFKLLTIQSFEVVQTTLASDFALKLFLPVKRHPSGVATVCSKGREMDCEWNGGAKVGWGTDSYVSKSSPVRSR